MGMLDAEGFIHITGRLSRFSKIGGEMVPHIRIEELLQRMMADDDEKLFVAVTAVPDERKGERLIVFHLPMEKTPPQIAKELAAQGLPNLWIPGNDSFFEVDEIPVLGTGKLDLQAIREMAHDRVAGGSAASR
jgi:acyl-[acyl-carrier-protein]-phospholipid O-acyltransferase/long-chain-fatty-acid--[acyl-carrier-protein] ligase